jgi:hypothetical protein
MQKLTKVLQGILRLAKSTSEPSSASRAGEQRDQSSMADFVRILQDHDSRKSN